MRRLPPTTPNPSADPTLEPKIPTFSEIFAAANPPPPDNSRLLLAICGALAVVFLSIGMAVVVDRLRLPNVMAAATDEAVNSPLDSERWLEDALNGQRQASSWDPYSVSSQILELRDPDSREASMRQPRSALLPSPGPRPRPVGRPPPNDTPQQDEEVDPAYAAMWGSAERYAALGRRASSERPAEAPSLSPVGPDTAGTQLRVRLLDRVAGAPTGAPVIALLARQERIGDRNLPANSELHGTVAGIGSQETRIFLEFNFARLRDGTAFPLRGVARDSQGRHGIPASKLLGKRSAGSVGLSTATRAIRQMGQRVAGRVGDVVGAGLEGATDSATDKAQRVDRDEVVLIAEPGTPFSVYVLAAG